MAARLRLVLLLATPPLLAAGCHSIFGIDEYEVAPGGSAGTTASGGTGAQPLGGGGATATGGTATTGGSTPSGGSGGAGGSGECSLPTDCPGSDSTCRSRTCIDHVCGSSDAAADTPCGDNNSEVCDGSGACVECNDAGDCSTVGDLCEDHLCVPAQCVDDAQNGSETDVDCGGADCPPCENGRDCLVYSDCQSRYCTTAHSCAACSDDAQCAAATNTYCNSANGGACVPKLNPGESCPRAGACLSGFCPADDDVCCNEACDGTCVACLASKTGGTTGGCSAVTAGTDPEDECMTGSGPCTPAGTGCNGSDLAPGCNLQGCSCATIFTVGGAILESCGPSAEGCDVRINTTLQTCAVVCQSHGTECVTVYNDAPADTCGRSLAEQRACTYNVYASGICVCTLGCGGGAPCEAPDVCTGGVCQ